MGELRLCPYCGNHDVTILHKSHANERLSYVYCWQCLTHGPARKNEQEAIEMWNRVADAQREDRAKQKAYTPVGVPCKKCGYLHDKRTGWCDNCGTFSKAEVRKDVIP